MSTGHGLSVCLDFRTDFAVPVNQCTPVLVGKTAYLSHATPFGCISRCSYILTMVCMFPVP